VVLGMETGLARPHSRWITAISVQASVVFSGGDDNLVLMTNFADGNCTPTAQCAGHEQGITAVVALPGGMSHPCYEIVTSSWDGTVRKWRIPKNPGERNPWDDPNCLSVGMEVARWCHPSGITDMSIDGDAIYTACDDGHAVKWALGAVGRQEKQHIKCRYGQRGVQCTKLCAWADSNGEQQLVVGRQDGSVYQYDTVTAECIRKFMTPVPVRCMAIIAEDGLLFTGGTDETVRKWNLADGTELAQLGNAEFGHYGGITCLHVEGDRVYTGSVDRTLREWDANTHAELTRYRGHSDTPLCLAQLNGMLYSGGCDIALRQWRPSEHTIPHIPHYRVNTLDGKCNWPMNNSCGSGKHLYHYAPDFV
jgi:WD40 repeat protein